MLSKPLQEISSNIKTAECAPVAVSGGGECESALFSPVEHDRYDQEVPLISSFTEEWRFFTQTTSNGRMLRLYFHLLGSKYEC